MTSPDNILFLTVFCDIVAYPANGGDKEHTGGHDDQQCYQATYQVPDNNAFWSITVYGSDGYMKRDNAVVNSSNVKLNDDGTFSVYYGSKELCGDVPNRLDVTEGWNFLMRVYRPGPSVVDGTYKLPNAVPVK